MAAKPAVLGRPSVPGRLPGCCQDDFPHTLQNQTASSSGVNYHPVVFIWKLHGIAWQHRALWKSRRQRLVPFLPKPHLHRLRTLRTVVLQIRVLAEREIYMMNGNDEVMTLLKASMAVLVSKHQKYFYNQTKCR